MNKESKVEFSENYQKLSCIEVNGCERRKKLNLKWCLSFSVLAILVLHSVISIWYLKNEIDQLQTKIMLLDMKAEIDVQILKDLQSLIFSKLTEGDQNTLFQNNEKINLMRNDNGISNEEETNSKEGDNISDSDGDINFRLKKKREIRDHNESSIKKEFTKIPKNETEGKSSGEKSSTEISSLENSKEKFFDSSSGNPVSLLTRKSHLHKKHRKSRIGSAERFITETHSTTSTPIQVRQSRTKSTELHEIDKTLWLQNQKFQQHTSSQKDTITKEEALKKGYAKRLEEGYDLETPKEHFPDVLSYNMITIHFSADTSHYSKERDPYYIGNGRMQIQSHVYKDWKPAHWTHGVDRSKYFRLHQGHVTVFTTGIYLIYAQIQYSTLQEVNGFGIYRNKDVVVQCITTSTHPDKNEIKSNTCGISTTILLQSNDSVCIKDLHHGRYVVLTPEKSYFGLVLLSPFKN